MINNNMIKNNNTMINNNMMHNNNTMINNNMIKNNNTMINNNMINSNNTMINNNRINNNNNMINSNNNIINNNMMSILGFNNQNNEFDKINIICFHHPGTVTEIYNNIYNTLANIKRNENDSSINNKTVYLEKVLKDLEEINNLIKIMKKNNLNQPCLPDIPQVSIEKDSILLDNDYLFKINHLEIKDPELKNIHNLLIKFNNINNFFIFGPLYIYDEKYLISVIINKLQDFVFDNKIINQNIMNFIIYLLRNLWKIFNKSYGIKNIKNQIQYYNSSPQRIKLMNIDIGQKIDIIFNIFQNIRAFINNMISDNNNKIIEIIEKYKYIDKTINGYFQGVNDLKKFIEIVNEPEPEIWTLEQNMPLYNIDDKKINTFIYNYINYIMNNHGITCEKDLQDMKEIVDQLASRDENYKQFAEDVKKKLDDFLKLINSNDKVNQKDFDDTLKLFIDVQKIFDNFCDDFSTQYEYYKKEYKKILQLYGKSYLKNAIAYIKEINFENAKKNLNIIFDTVLDIVMSHKRLFYKKKILYSVYLNENNINIFGNEKISSKVKYSDKILQADFEEIYMKLKKNLLGILTN